DGGRRFDGVEARLSEHCPRRIRRRRAEVPTREVAPTVTRTRIEPEGAAEADGLEGLPLAEAFASLPHGFRIEREVEKFGVGLDEARELCGEVVAARRGGPVRHDGERREQGRVVGECCGLTR